MEKTRLAYLLERYRDHACSPAELTELHAWYEQLDYGSSDFDQWVAEAGGETQFADQSYLDFQNRARASAAGKYWWNRIGPAGKVAAAVLMVSGMALFFYISDLNRQELTANQATQPIQPGSNKAVLTLADGTSINLDEASSGLLAQQEGMGVSKTDAGQLIYNAGNKKAAHTREMAYNTVRVPRGGQYQLSLPDGSRVWLNAESTLQFPVTSNGKDRRLRLTGEAYFEVAHQKDQPFIVLTGNQEVRVLGTHFNIKGYTEEKDMQTTLLEGSVQISQLSSGQSKILRPGDQASISGHQAGIYSRRVNTDRVVAWKNGYFIFDNEDLGSIMKVIGRWYDVDVVFRSGVPKERFGGTFSRSSNLAELLHNLEELGEVHFEVQQRKILVSIDQKKNII